ncbi:MAG: class III extradiol ring-cleavage dioxygenase, partial [Moraxellaceae bacterium]|nr:class III extradiol ring-cleavage dioxygenase [Moraxellaceae bacterium]
APGAPVLAQRVRALLEEEEGIAASLSDTRGLDHGAWVPLRQMYPDADIPVTQLSVQPGRDAAWHLALGRALQCLRTENVLVIASGSLTHNLHEVMFAEQGTAASEDYVRDFQEWMHQALVMHNDTALQEWETQAPFARRAHPTPEHFLPLLVAYAAAGPASAVRRTVSSFSHGVLAMDCYVFGEG